MDEREPLRDWSLAILGALEPVIGPEVFARGNKAVKDFLGYLEILVERRRAKPGNPERDVLTRLIQGEDNGERLTSKELLHNCIFLLNAGHETTTNLIGNGLVALSHYPQQKTRLIENPAMIKTAIEEMLRFESSNQLGNRMTVEPVELGGIAMPAGTPVTLCIGAANRDPQQFADPENSISAARRTATSPSAPARINAQGWRWRGSKARSRSRVSWRGFRTCAQWRTGARRPGPLPWIFERAVCGQVTCNFGRTPFFLFGSGRVEGGKVAVRLGIFHPAQLFGVFDHGRFAPGGPRGFAVLEGFQFFRRPPDDDRLERRSTPTLKLVC